MSGAPAHPGSGLRNRRTQLIVLGVLAALIRDRGDRDQPVRLGRLRLGRGRASGDTAEVEERSTASRRSGVFLGEPDAPEVVTEFVDLQCPFCGEFSRNALPDVIDQHVRSGDVRYELRADQLPRRGLGARRPRWPRRRRSRTSSDEFAETFYLNQGEENSGYVTDEFLLEIAERRPASTPSRRSPSATRPRRRR